MENKLDTNEIEESLRICEELFQNNPDFNRRAPRPVEALKLAKNVTAPVVDPKPAVEPVPTVEPVPVTKPVSEEKTEPAKPVGFPSTGTGKTTRNSHNRKRTGAFSQTGIRNQTGPGRKKGNSAGCVGTGFEKRKIQTKYKEKFDCVWHLRCDCYCDRTDHYQFCCQSYQSGGKFHGIYFGKR